MNDRWNLDILYKGFDDPAFKEDSEKLAKHKRARTAISRAISIISIKSPLVS